MYRRRARSCDSILDAALIVTTLDAEVSFLAPVLPRCGNERVHEHGHGCVYGHARGHVHGRLYGRVHTHAHGCAYRHVPGCVCTGMRTDVGVDMCTGTFIDMFADMCTGMPTRPQEFATWQCLTAAAHLVINN